jgi:imidazolonepropionase-like amidohydrolase
VDDRDRTEQKLPPAVYRAIIDEAHKRNLRVVAHIRELEDAKNVLRAGVDGFAHPPRDVPVDVEFLDIVKRHPGVFFLTTLWGERLGGSAGVPEWINEPIARETFSAAERQTLADPFRTSSPQQIAQSRKYVETTRANVAKLAAAGARFGLGTDAGGNTGGQFFGLSAHVEMEMMVAAGLTPDQVIVAATRNSARILGLEDRGTIASGQSADFIVLDADPRQDIRNTRKIASVYLRGRQVDRPALRAKWSTQ